MNKTASQVIRAIKACESGKYTEQQLKLVKLVQAAPLLLEATQRLITFEAMGPTSDNTRKIVLNFAENALKIAGQWE